MIDNRLFLKLECRMLKSTALKHYGSCAAIARAINRGATAVVNWPKIVPEGMAYKIQVLTKGRVRVDPALYAKSRGHGR